MGMEIYGSLVGDYQARGFGGNAKKQGQLRKIVKDDQEGQHLPGR